MNNLKRGFIDKEKLLTYVTEEDIFKLVFEEIPEEFEYITSPFREDNSPGCWFQKGLKGDLRFVDFGNSQIISGINMGNIDCFNAVQVYYNLANFYHTMEFINSSLLRGKKDKLVRRSNIIDSKEYKKPRFYFEVEVLEFNVTDGRYWSSYGITKENLIEDKVFSVLKYKLFNTKTGDYEMRPDSLCYVFTEFKDNKKKLYFPMGKDGVRFITDCTEDDIGGMKSLPESGNKLIISKSYKDWRVLKNSGYDVVWLQAEVMFPSNNVLISLCNRFKEIVVFFDNDRTGLTMAQRLAELINTFLPNRAKSLWLPEEFKVFGVKDPADMRKVSGMNRLEKFLSSNI